ncbi:MAG: prolyl oligopeptidase family serine peptidase [Chitinophagaceae bacterium]
MKYILALANCIVLSGYIQTRAQAPALKEILNFQTVTELTASEEDNVLVWAAQYAGSRNVFMAKAPSYAATRVTSFSEKDEQEISSLTLSKNSQYAVFVRGGDHGGYLYRTPNNAQSYPNAPTISIWSVNLAPPNTQKRLADGDDPAISPDGQTVAFLKNGDIWSVPIDGGTAKALVHTLGKCGDIQWSPDGKQIAFVSNRQGHAFIGIFTDSATAIRWVAPALFQDYLPRWSLDGKKIAFIRNVNTHLDTDSILVRRPDSWQIVVNDLATNQTKTIFQSPNTLAGGTEPNTKGGFNLNWMADEQLCFLSYQDTWPHLYTISANGGKEKCLTPGNYMVEYPQFSKDKKKIYFAANIGKDALDIDRRHIAKVSLDGNLTLLTKGNGIEAYPFPLSDNQVACIASNTVAAPVPALIQANGSLKNLITQPNTKTAEKGFIAPKQVTFTTPDGLKVHAQLFLPKNAKGKIPAVVFVHGGPDRQMFLGWHYSPYYSNCYAINQYLATHGFAVLAVNYRCGIGYGFDFDEPDGQYSHGAAEYTDVQSAGKWLQQQDYIDTRRIGIYGGSYGGYLTSLALSKNSDIFAAGVDIHGVHQHHAEEENYKNSDAPDAKLALETERKSFAIHYVAQWKSPVLLIHGDDDRNVDFQQSLDLSKALLRYNIPFEYLVIPDDTHHWMNSANQEKIDAATVEFLERKLGK